MTAQTTQKLAGLLGYSLGRCVRFFFQDQNSALRWVSVVLSSSWSLCWWLKL